MKIRKIDLRNTANIVRNYNQIFTSITSFSSVVTMISGLVITKEVDKFILADGLLIYTVIVDSFTTDGVLTISYNYIIVYCL